MDRTDSLFHAVQHGMQRMGFLVVRHDPLRDLSGGFFRKLGYIAAAALVAYLVSMFAPAKAYAQSCPTMSYDQRAYNVGRSNTYATSNEAKAACNSYGGAAYASSGAGPYEGGWLDQYTFKSCTISGNGFTLTVKHHSTLQPGCITYSGADPNKADVTRGGWVFTTLSPECPAGQVMNPETNACWVAPTPEDCANRNDTIAAQNTIVFGGASACINGCSYGPNGPVTTTNPGGIRSGGIGYTGSTCTAPPPNPKPDPEKPKQECVPNGSLTMCVKPNGDHCYSASTGRMICWKPGETGEKVDGPTKQVNSPGSNPNPPTAPNSGDTQVPGGTSNTSTSGPGGNTTNNISNFNTGSGNGAAPPTRPGEPKPQDQGEPGDGKGKTDEDKDKNGSASGGGDCDTPSTGEGNAIMLKIAELSWRARCSWDATGLDGDEGSEGEGASIFSGDQAPEADLDDSGYGLSRTCPESPQITIGGYTKTIDTSGLCDLAGIIGALVLLAGFAQGIWAFAGRG